MFATKETVVLFCSLVENLSKEWVNLHLNANAELQYPALCLPI